MGSPEKISMLFCIPPASLGNAGFARFASALTPITFAVFSSERFLRAGAFDRELQIQQARMWTNPRRSANAMNLGMAGFSEPGGRNGPAQ